MLRSHHPTCRVRETRWRDAQNKRDGGTTAQLRRSSSSVAASALSQQPQLCRNSSSSQQATADPRDDEPSTGALRCKVDWDFLLKVY